MAVLTPREAAAIRTVSYRRFDFTHKMQQAEAFYRRVCMINPSDSADESYDFLSSMPQMREWLGDRVYEQLKSGTFRIKNRLWEQSIQLERHRYSDDRAKQFGNELQELAGEAAHHPDELLFETMLAGETDKCWDEQPFFGTTHQYGSSGVQSNIVNHTVVDPNAPTTQEIKDAFNAARLRMVRFKNDRGARFHRATRIKQSGLMIIAAPELQQVFIDSLYTRIFGHQPGIGGDNVTIDQPQFVGATPLEDRTTFYLLKIDNSFKPFVFQPREKLQRQMVGGDSIKEKTIEFLTEARYAMGYGSWMHAIKVNLV